MLVHAHGADVSHSANDAAAGCHERRGRVIAQHGVDHRAECDCRSTAADASCISIDGIAVGRGLKQQAAAAAPQSRDAGLRE